jgi:hypothetical protein
MPSILTIRSSDASLNTIVQPDASIPGSEIVFDAITHIYYPSHDGVQCKCRSAEIVSTGANGNLEVHLTKDPVDRWYIMELVAGQEKGRYFNAIRSTNTTATLSQVTLFPCA